MGEEAIIDEVDGHQGQGGMAADPPEAAALEEVSAVADSPAVAADSVVEEAADRGKRFR